MIPRAGVPTRNRLDVRFFAGVASRWGAPCSSAGGRALTVFMPLYVRTCSSCSRASPLFALCLPSSPWYPFFFLPALVSPFSVVFSLVPSKGLTYFDLISFDGMCFILLLLSCMYVYYAIPLRFGCNLCDVLLLCLLFCCVYTCFILLLLFCSYFLVLGFCVVVLLYPFLLCLTFFT